MTQELPSIIAGGAYELRKLLGSGGMADVYLAFDLKLRRYRAVKILHPNKSQSKELRARLEVEAQSMAQLEEHENVVRVFSQGVDGDCYFIVMEFIDGNTIEQLMWRPSDGDQELGHYERLPWPTIVEVMTGVMKALQAAHAVGIVHRDVKPQNIMLPKTGKVKVMDFGIAQSPSGQRGLTKTGVKMGTPSYCSPEQAEDLKNADWRSDIYSVGALLFFLLTGNGNTLHLFIAEEGDQRLSAVPAAFLPIVRKATAYKREDRYQSAEEFLKAFNEVCRGYESGSLKPHEVLPVVHATVTEPATTYVHDPPSEEIALSQPKPLHPLTVAVEPVSEEVPKRPSLTAEFAAVPHVEVVEEEVGEEVIAAGWARWLKAGAKAGVTLTLLLGLGWGVKTMMAQQEIAEPEVAPVEVVVQPVIEVQPEIKPVPVTVPDKIAVKTTPTLKPKPDVVKSEVKPVVVPVVTTPVVQTPEKARIVAPAMSGTIGSGSLGFSAGLMPNDPSARGTLIFRVGSDPKWQRRPMPLGSNGRYELTIDVDKAASQVEYVIEIVGESEGTLRSGTAQNPHVVKP